MVFREISLRRGFSRIPGSPLTHGKRQPLMLGLRKKSPAVGIIKIHYFRSQNCYFLIFLFFLIKFHPSRSPRTYDGKKHNSQKRRDTTAYVFARSNGRMCQATQFTTQDVKLDRSLGTCRKELKARTQTCSCTLTFTVALFTVVKR